MMRGGSAGSRLAASAERARNFCWRHSFSTLDHSLTVAWSAFAWVSACFRACLRVGYDFY